MYNSQVFLLKIASVHEKPVGITLYIICKSTNSSLKLKN